ncbi:FAD/NAD(P)-binding domain-containing protein [Ramaria rubella]|nr:FAD/NAD(P)-binding domain-containing protein [Ramaria rubella]
MTEVKVKGLDANGSLAISFVRPPGGSVSLRLPSFYLSSSTTGLYVMVSNTLPTKRLRILIVGGGLSGLALANGLLNAAHTAPIEVLVFERDTDEYLKERGGYQIRLSHDGISGLKQCLDDVTYAELKCRYGAGTAEAPTLMDPKTTQPVLRLSDYRIYAKARAMSRRVLRAQLLQKVIAANAIQFGKRVVAFDIVYANDGEHVKIFFEDGTHETGDILIAADGSKSFISEQVGLNNRTQVNGGFHLTSRGPVSDVVISKLPKVLQDDGAVGFYGSGVFGFISIYRTADPGDITTVTDKPYCYDPHLYWAISFPGQSPPRFNTSRSHDLKAAQRDHAKELMRSKGCHQALIDILDIGSVDTIRLTTEMLTSTQPPYNWRDAAQKRIGKNGGHRRVFLIGDSIHPMTPGRGMGANEALQDAAVLLPYLISLSRSAEHANPDEVSYLVEVANAHFELEMFPRAFGWVRVSNRSAEMDVSTREGKIFMYLLWLAMSLAGCFNMMLEAVGLKRSNEPVM